ncbi:MAG: hypothetical protein MI748_03810 [Opitutales bacterium]|nr:hypothetical protein [Opitutales bacterium]
MIPSNYQLLDLREPSLRLYRATLNSFDLDFEVPFTVSSTGDSDWLEKLRVSLDAINIPLRRHLMVVLPVRLMLSRLVRVPHVGGTGLNELILHEVGESVPHAKEAFEWSRVRLCGDEIEEVFLVFAIRRDTKQAIARCLGGECRANLTFLSAAALEFFDVRKFREGLSFFLHLEKGAGLLVAGNEKEGFSRSFRYSGNDVSDYLPEIRKAKSILRRQYSDWSGGALHLSTETPFDPSDVTQIQETIGAERVEHAVELSDSITRFVEVIAKMNSGSVSPSDQLQFSGSNVAKKRDSSDLVFCFALGLLALTPFVFWLGNLSVTRHYKESSRAYRLEEKAQRINLEREQALKKSLSELHGQLNSLQRDEALSVAWIGLMNDLQNAMFQVKDIWLDEMNARIGAEVEGASLTCDGRFLLKRTNNVESVKVEVINDTKKRLSQLQSLLLESSYVSDLKNFSASYEGIEKGVNVVAFSLEVALAEPFQERRLQ